MKIKTGDKVMCLYGYVEISKPVPGHLDWWTANLLWPCGSMAVGHEVIVKSMDCRKRTAKDKAPQKPYRA